MQSARDIERQKQAHERTGLGKWVGRQERRRRMSSKVAVECIEMRGEGEREGSEGGR